MNPYVNDSPIPTVTPLNRPGTKTPMNLYREPLSLLVEAPFRLSPETLGPGVPAESDPRAGNVRHLQEHPALRGGGGDF